MQAHTYSLYNFIISSNLPLPRLTAVSQQTAQIEVLFQAPSDHVPEPGEDWIYQEKRPDGAPYMGIARSEGGYLLRLHGLGDFSIFDNGRTVQCVPRSGISHDALQATLLYPILIMLLNHLGLDGLHASSIAVENGAIAFCGLSGMGKSTLAGSFASRGFAVLNDEFLPLTVRDGSIYTIPGLSEIRLWPSSYARFGPLQVHNTTSNGRNAKVIVELGGGLLPPDPTPLHSIYFLERGQPSDPAVEIQPYYGHEAFIKLVNYSYRLDAQDRQMLKRQAQLFTQIANEGRVKRLKLKWGFDYLEEAMAHILLDNALP